MCFWREVWNATRPLVAGERVSVDLPFFWGGGASLWVCSHSHMHLAITGEWLPHSVRSRKHIHSMERLWETKSPKILHDNSKTPKQGKKARVW